MLLPVSLGAATGAARVVACRCFSCQVRQHTEGAPAPATEATVLRNPLQKKRNRRSLRKHVATVAVRLPVLPLLSAVRLLLRGWGVSLLPLLRSCRVLPRCAAPRSRRRRCVALLRTQPLLPVVLPTPAAPGAAPAPALLLLVVGAGRTAPVKPTAIVVNDNTLFRVAP